MDRSRRLNRPRHCLWPNLILSPSTSFTPTPADFARFALQHDDLEVLDVIDTEQPTVKAHRADSLIRVRVAGGEALVHHEFQTTDSDPPMPYRMVGYIGRGIQQHRLPIYSIVIYLRPDAGRTDPGY